ncbi:MAG TPA: hypothetical protein VIN11_07530 [Roseivirga sp.]
MTLVVGRVLADGKILIKSDSKITDLTSVKNEPLCGALKSLILHPNVSVSFAGNVTYAEEALKLFYEQRIDGLKRLLDLLLIIHNKSNNGTDFVVATLENNKSIFYKVSNFKIESSNSSFWIGDSDAFSEYQELYHLNYKESSDVALSMKSAFRSLIQNPNFPSVDHFFIEMYSSRDVMPGDHVFLYEERFEADSGFFVNTVPANTKMPLAIGGASTGSYSISHFITLSPVYHGIGVYFEFGRFGAFFCPQLQLFKPIIIEDVDGQEFADKLKSDFGIPVRGFVIEKGSRIKLIDTRSI